MDGLAGAPQLLPRGIDFEIPEAKAQNIPPSATRFHGGTLAGAGGRFGRKHGRLQLSFMPFRYRS
jgi:hypothetical protein